jgi:hypothetical protein
VVVEIIVFVLLENLIENTMIRSGIIPYVPADSQPVVRDVRVAPNIMNAMISNIEVVRLIPRMSCFNFASVKL